MIFAYLVLAHLLGDFVFQPTKLVLWKIKSKKGVFVHVLIHFLTGLILFSPLIVNGYTWIILLLLGINFIHFWIDEAKINYDLRHDKKVRPFVIDQLLHFLTIIVGYFFISDINIDLNNSIFWHLYSDIRLIGFFSFLVFSSTVIDIFHFQKQREKNIKAKLKLIPGKILDRMIVFTLIYAVFMFFSIYATGKSVINF